MSATAAARFFRVLGDPTRLQILELLAQGERSVGELVAAVGQPQPRVSTHLACLRHCVTTERRGKEVIYWLALSGLDGIVGRAAEVMAPLAERLATCTHRAGLGLISVSPAAASSGLQDEHRLAESEPSQRG